jgi:hypothetical protein
MGLPKSGDAASRFSAYVEGLASVIGHADPLLAERHARHLAGRALTLQDARKPMHTDPSTIC